MRFAYKNFFKSLLSKSSPTKHTLHRKDFDVTTEINGPKVFLLYNNELLKMFGITPKRPSETKMKMVNQMTRVMKIRVSKVIMIVIKNVWMQVDDINE